MARVASSKKNKGNRAAGGAQAENRALRANAGRAHDAVETEPLLVDDPNRDIAGIVLAIAGVASLIAVIAPSTAPIAKGLATFYHLGFGLGGYLLPFGILAVSALVFLRDRAPVPLRIGAGLGIVFFSVLGILALLTPGAEGDARVLFDTVSLVSRGGIAGAYIASGLLALLGKAISLVVLVGLVLVGLVITGLSFGQVVRSAADRARQLAARRRIEVNDRPWGDEAPSAPVATPVPPRHRAAVGTRGQGRLFDADAAPETTFLGNRETLVMPQDEPDDPSESPLVDIEAREASGAAEPTRVMAAKPVGKRSRSKQGSRSATAASATDEAPQTEFTADEGPVLGWNDDDDAPWDVVRADSDADSSAPTEADEASPATVIDASTGTQQPIPDFLQRPRSDAPASASDPGHPVQGAPSAVSVAPAETADGDAADRELPPTTMLRHNPQSARPASSSKELEQTAQGLQSTLQEFGLHSSVVGWIAGPTVTTFKVQPGEGERVSRINSLEDDIALTLATDSVRIFAPIPGTSLVGIEIPNRTRQTVDFGDILPYVKGGPLEFALGRDAEGAPMVADLSKMPHLLIAGTTGSGKSVVISSIVMSLLMRTFPEDVRLIMIDPKRVEFAPYDGLPHLYVPVVTEPKQAASALQWAVSEMERRLKVFERIGVRKISTFNEKQAAGEFEKYDNPPAKMPYLVIVIDELSDLMMVAGKDVEASIVRIAQLGRAAGIHMIVATQRPSSNVVTGLIKANITNRIGLTVATGIDSRVILDQTGAEKLTGQGDMLFSRVDWGKPKRIQGCFVSDEEIASVVDFVKEHSQAEYHEEILSAVSPAPMGAPGSAAAEQAEDDPLLWDAARIVVDSQLGSTSGLQRRLKVGYARAGRIMDMLEEKGVVGPPDGSKPREVLLDMEALKALEAIESPLTEEEIRGDL